MQLQHRLEWHEEQHLLIGIALNPVPVGALAPRQRARLLFAEEHPHAASIPIDIQQFASGKLNLARNILIAARQLGAQPALATASTAAPFTTATTDRVHSVVKLSDYLLQLKRVCALNTLDDLAISEDDECRQRGDPVCLGDVLLLVGVDLDECHEIRTREGV